MEQEQVEVDIDAVVNSLTNQVANQSRELAVKDGIINKLQADNAALRAKVDELAEATAEETKGKKKTGAKS